MRTPGTAAVLVLLVTAAACGQQRSPTSESGTPGSQAYDACAGKGSVVARADLDDDGSDEDVRLVRDGTGPCADVLVATVGDTVAGVQVRGLDLEAKTARTVHLKGPDAPDLVLVSSQPHPRGGSQPHLFGAGGPDGLTEVTADGNPVVPFVATDGGAAPMTANCTDDGGIAVLTGTAHQPPGIVLAWDVQQTVYDVREGRAVNPRTSMVRKAAADPLLRKEMPELFGGTLFSGCP